MNVFDKTQAARRPGSACGFCAAVAALEAPLRRDLEKALDARKYTSSTIAEVLDGWGVQATAQTVSRHRPFTAGGKCRTKYPKGTK